MKFMTLNTISDKNRLLLHTCCAPCSTHVINVLKSEFTITAYFYNPNIHPHDEYERRLHEIKKVCQSSHIELIEGGYEILKWFQGIRGFEAENEGGKRCTVCFQLRLDKTASFARDNGYKFYATTLTISPHKNARVINQIGRKLQEKYGTNFYEADFKKNDGFKRSCELSREYRLYRQNYCGCIFSKER